MNINEAIEVRSSRRVYTSKAIEARKVEKLKKLIAQINQDSGLHLQLYINNGDAFSGLKMSYGIFKNVSNYIALVGNAKDQDYIEKLGYYGEKLVLEATMLNLGTCWVGGTYDKKTCKCEIRDNENLLGIITLGYTPDVRPFKERMVYSIIRRKTKPISEMLISDTEKPIWLMRGMEAVQKAPSAVNMQPVRMNYKAGELTAAVAGKPGYEMMDLGIAKLHFEIGSDYRGHWNWGNKERFVMN
jgi:nitroreductase